MNSFLVDVSSALSEPGASIEVDDEVPLGEVECGDTLLVFEEPPRVSARLVRTDIGLVLSGTVTASAKVECSRCLEPFVLTVVGAIEGGFNIPSVAPLTDIDEDWGDVVGESVDLMPSIESAIRLEVPLAPVHDESCLGICPTCGSDLNIERCSCEVTAGEAAANPFAALKDLKHPVTPSE
ncbi:MAG: DUF177 domain-containing protein [Clostridiales bacterium]|nr:DUF177 domain-containing protein [Clostridiales bacterium]